MLKPYSSSITIKRNQSLTSQVLHIKPEDWVFSVGQGPLNLTCPEELESRPGPPRHIIVFHLSRVYTHYSSQQTVELGLKALFSASKQPPCGIFI